MSDLHGRLIKTLSIVALAGLAGGVGIVVARFPELQSLLHQATRARLPGAPVDPLPCATPVPPSSRAAPFTVTADVLALRQLLSVGWYDQIDSTLHAYGALLPCDSQAEWDLAVAVEAFRVVDTLQAPLLDDWVERSHGSANARLARAEYWSEHAWQARGTRLARETRAQQFLEMVRSFERARADLDTVLAADPHALMAYVLLLDAALAEGDRLGARAIVDRGLHAWPASFLLRRAYMRTLIPRWGGSYDAMAAFAREAQPQVPQNPSLNVLQGYPPWAQGVDVRYEGDTVRSLEFFTEALRYGEFPPFLTDRAKSLHATGRSLAAQADLDRAILLWPHYAEAWRERGIVLYELGERSDRATRATLWPRALDNLRAAARLDPGDTRTGRWVAYLTRALRP